MRGQLNFIQGNLSVLQQMNWVDSQTRAIFVEFSVYNPNVNLVMVSTILIEFLSSGSILTSARFDPINLFNETGSISFKTICEIVFIAFILYFLYNQINEAINRDLKEYLNDFWTYIEWFIILTAFISFAMILVRIKTAKDVLDFFKATAGFGYMKLQRANECNQVLTYCLGLCTFFGTIKFLKMLRFNKNIAYLGLTLKLCMLDLVSFGLVFFLIWIPFVQWMYLMFSCDLNGYLSLIKTMQSAFLILLGKSDTLQFFVVSPIIGPIIYASYFLANICFALNIFISIITDAFSQVRLNTKHVEDNFYDFYEHAKKRLQRLLYRRPQIDLNKKYRDQLSNLPMNINRLANIIFRVRYIF
jgi:polycystin 1L2